MNAVFDVTADTFQEDVIERSKEVPVVVDFWGPRCGPCLVLGPNLEKLANAAGGKWVLAKVNTEENQQLAFDFRITGIPAVKAIKDGEVIHEFVGALPVPQIEKWLDLFVPNEIDELFDAALSAIDAGDLEDANRALDNMGDDPRAHVGRANVALAKGDGEAAKEHLEKIPERLLDKVTPSYSEVWIQTRAFGKSLDEVEEKLAADKNDRQAQFDRAMIHAANGAFEKAFEDLIWIVTVDRNFGEDLARIAAVRLFDVVGIHSELANVWRSKLGQAMY